MAPVTVGLFVSSIAIVVVSLATQSSSPVPAHVLAAMEETTRLGPIPREMMARSDFALRPEAEEIESLLKNGDLP